MYNGYSSSVHAERISFQSSTAQCYLTWNHTNDTLQKSHKKKCSGFSWVASATIHFPSEFQSRILINVTTPTPSKTVSQNTYNVTLWRVRVAIVAMETQQFVLCVLLRCLCQPLKISKFAQKCFHGKPMSPAAEKRTRVFEQSVRYFCLILTSCGESRRIFSNVPNIQYN